MEYNIRSFEKRKVAGFHLVGPWGSTVPQGFKQLSLWVQSQQVPAQEWIAVYYDNPDEVPPEKLRADAVVTVPEGFVIPDNSPGVILTEIPGGAYAVARARVYNDDYEAPWRQFITALLADAQYQIAPRPCLEVYLNCAEEDGFWEIDMYIPVEPKAR
ncbi:DNA gyrase inhibitor SbmC [Phytobacter massiliensis]|uniref:DNA gyrase inhibitor SbmC n=1 Tax=Phytobacter massiliensis TaxID=1485952 RepID=UPI000306D556|nr:DNA gyrase inhibitor SbmC [Phytobacter massiliensis]